MPGKRVLILVIFLFSVSHQVFSQAPTITSFTPTSGRTGTIITINGTNFTGATAVSFGGTPASTFSILSPIKIIAFVGTGSSGSVSVTTPSGTASRPGFTFIPPPIINSFLPTVAGYGDTITIKGINFTGATNVFFGGTLASSFTVISDTAITAIVGNGASGNVVITSTFGVGSLAGFIHTGPVITSFTPTSGGPGTIVKIKGYNFNGTTNVSFGGYTASSFNVDSSTGITAVVGIVGSIDTLGTIAVTTPQGTGTIGGFNAPYIYSINPNTGSLGTTVTIKGINFSGVTAVRFGGTNAGSFNVLSDTTITAVLGYGSSGTVKTVTATGTATGPTFFYNSPLPTITSFTPVSGSMGTIITIKGTGFTSAQVVYVGGGLGTTYTVVSDSIINAVVGSTSSGNVSVITQGGFASLPGFIYTGPVISSFFPVTGVTGTPITIKGSNLTGTTSVSFGGIPAASFTIDSSTGITAVVGSGASGNITLTATSGTASFGIFKMVPLINSFSPTSGPIGIAVTINGANFDPVASNNIIYFGAVKATILSSSATQLIVTVPAGTTPEPLSVTTNNITGYSNQPFAVTFPNDNTSITTNSFAPKIDYYAAYQYSPWYGVNRTCISDLDGDGKPEIVMLRDSFTEYFGALSVFRNTSHDGIVSFADRVDFAQYLINATGISCKDIDGDGKADIAITCSVSPTSFVAIFRNTSTPGNISFAQTIFFTTTDYPGDVSIGDLDGDGKPELVIPNENGTSFISVFKNNSSSGFISLGPRVDYPIGAMPADIAIKDLDGDNKPDLAISNSSGVFISVLKNTSTLGTISFTQLANIPSWAAGKIFSEDIDGDEKPDIITRTSSGNVFSVFRNTGGNGVISFAPQIDFPTGAYTYGCAVGDVDGDGKADIVVGNNIHLTGNYYDLVSVFKNLSSNGTISFGPMASYTTGDRPVDVSIGDLNCDGKPDLVTANRIGYTASVFINKMGDSAVVTLCPPVGSAALTADLTGGSYQWQVNTGNGFADISDNSNYTGTNTNALQLTNIPSAWYSYKYRCRVDGNYSVIFSLRFANTWTGNAGTAWENSANWSCGTVPDINTDVIINSGTVVLNSNVTIRRLTLATGVTFTIAPGVALTITNP